MTELLVDLVLASWYLSMVHSVWLTRENARKWDNMETTTIGPFTIEVWFEDGKWMSRRIDND